VTATLAGPGPEAPALVPRLRRVRYEPAPGEPPSAPTPVSSQPASPPRVGVADGMPRHAQLVLQLVLEALDGRRPLGHLAPHFAPSALRYLRAARRPRCGEPARLTSVHVCRPGSDAAEIAAVYRLAGRARAVAARFERPPDRPLAWQCVAIRLG
jgi:Family of unknown function (DUF6459)